MLFLSLRLIASQLTWGRVLLLFKIKEVEISTSFLSTKRLTIKSIDNRTFVTSAS